MSKTELTQVTELATRAAAVREKRGAALWMKIVLAQRLLNTAAQRFWGEGTVRRRLPSFLLELYSMVRCSVPLMTSGLERAVELAPGDWLAAITAEYLERHIREERHHDEWLLDDLTFAGLDRASVLGRVPSANVARLVGAQYCWVHHSHPAALFGWLAVIEGNPPLPQHLAEMQRLSGYPPEVFRCLHQHAADDIEHLTELRATITELPLSDGEAELISLSAFATLRGLVDIFEELEAEGERQGQLPHSSQKKA